MKKNTYKPLTVMLVLTMMLSLISGCTDSTSINVGTTAAAEETAAETEGEETAEASSDWEASHSNEADPDYEVVFPEDEVLEIFITIDPEDWETMNTDLEENLSSVNEGLGGGKAGGNAGGGRGRQGMAEGEEMPERPEMVEGEMAMERPEMAEGETMMERPEMPDTEEIAAVEETTEDSDYEPIWVESTITFEDDVWEHVGIRFKGNSTLTSVASSDNDKFSFKLDFDEFEEAYTETEDQRFYGFKQLNLNNNFGDETLMHESLASDLFRDAGVVSAETTFAAVYVDYGEGYEYFGLYTIVEEVDDTVLDEQFGDDDGNLYKPDGDAASFADGTYDTSEMEKKNNEDEADYSDVEALYTIINSDTRTSDVEMWKEELESVFDVDMFLKWLAVNTTIVNWDTYGTMTHNYYLYNNPETGLLTWIPWDNNESLTSGKKGQLSLSLTEVGDNWPLISYIMEIDEYEAIYEAYLAEFTEGVFDEAAVTAKIEAMYELIQPYAYAEEEGHTFLSSDEAFDSAVEDLIDHVEERNEAVDTYLGDS